MAIYRTKIMAAALKVQVAESSDAIPTLALDAVRIAGPPPTMQLAWTEDGDRSDNVTGNMGSAGSATPVAATVSVELPMELHGRGSVYTSIADLPSSALDAMLRIGGMAKAFAAGVQSYTDAEGALELGSLYVWGGDGVLYKFIDCVAKLRVNLTANKPGILTGAITGTLSVDPAAGAIAGLVLPATMPAPWTGATVTTLGTWSTATAAPNQLVARSATVTMNETVTERPWAGASGLRGRVITDRMPELALETEAVALTAFDPFAQARLAKGPADTTPQFSTTIPGGVGNTVIVETGTVRLGLPRPLDFGGLSGWGLGGKVIAKTLVGGTASVRIAFS